MTTTIFSEVLQLINFTLKTNVSIFLLRKKKAITN